jgi:hypothetical protein
LAGSGVQGSWIARSAIKVKFQVLAGNLRPLRYAEVQFYKRLMQRSSRFGW